jgi:hypothetical protein
MALADFTAKIKNSKFITVRITKISNVKTLSTLAWLAFNSSAILKRTVANLFNLCRRHGIKCRHYAVSNCRFITIMQKTY